jgi:hypothetical protein
MQAYYMQIGEYLRSLPAERFPYTVSLVGAIMSGGGDERFDLGLEVLISGLEHAGSP